MPDFEIYIQEPTPFILEHWHRLLPDWRVVPQSLVLILLRAQFSLEQEGILMEVEKDRLYRDFLKIAELLHQAIHDQGYLSEIISPKDGLPVQSAPGTLIFDSVAAVNYWLGFSYDRTAKGCKVLNHPQWQRAVYPGLLLSAAPLAVLQSQPVLILPTVSSD